MFFITRFVTISNWGVARFSYPCSGISGSHTEFSCFALSYPVSDVMWCTLTACFSTDKLRLVQTSAVSHVLQSLCTQLLTGCLLTEVTPYWLLTSPAVDPQIGGGHNINPMVSKVAVGTIEESRELRLQSFNQYRKRFNLTPYTSFREFTGKANDSVSSSHGTNFTSPRKQLDGHSWN